MPTRYKIYWYQRSVLIANAFLYNCRNGDLKKDPNHRIKKATIIEGAIGCSITEHAVPGFRGTSVRFKANRKCLWSGIVLPCMTHIGIPKGRITKPVLRRYQYAVAQMDKKAMKVAVQKEVPIVKTKGKYFLNLELSTFERQKKGNARRAKLI